MKRFLTIMLLLCATPFTFAQEVEKQIPFFFSCSADEGNELQLAFCGEFAQAFANTGFIRFINRNAQEDAFFWMEVLPITTSMEEGHIAVSSVGGISFRALNYPFIVATNGVFVYDQTSEEKDDGLEKLAVQQFNAIATWVVKHAPKLTTLCPECPECPSMTLMTSPATEAHNETD